MSDSSLFFSISSSMIRSSSMLFCLFASSPLFHSIREKREAKLFPRQLGGFNLVMALLATWLGHAYHNE